MPSSTQKTVYAKAPFTKLLVSNPFLLSNFLSFLPSKDFLSLSKTSRAWRSFLDQPTPGTSKPESHRIAELRIVVLARYVDGFGILLREIGLESIAFHQSFGIDLYWEDLVLLCAYLILSSPPVLPIDAHLFLVISQQTPLSTYPTHALSALSPSASGREFSQNSRLTFRTARLARLTLAHSRFVLLLQSIAHSSTNPLPKEDVLPVPDTNRIESSRGHNRASSAGSTRELVFPAPLATSDPMMQASKSMVDISGTLSARLSRITQSANKSGGLKASSASLRSSRRAPSSFLSPPSANISPSPSSRADKRASVASFLKKSSTSPPPPVSESRALREYSSNFGWRRGLNDAKGKWEAATISYHSRSSLRTQSADDTIGYGSEIDDDELFSTPRRRFVGSDAGVSGSESSFSEGTLSSSTSASNSTSATSISGFDSPPPLPQKELVSGAEAFAISRGRVRPANVDVVKMWSDGTRRRHQSSSHSDSGNNGAPSPSRVSPVRPSLLNGSGLKQSSIPPVNVPPVPDMEDCSNPHALRLATSRIRAPVLRVFVPTSNMSVSPANDFSPSDYSGLSRCEDELLRAGLWEHLSVGDVVCNLGYVPPSISPFQGSSSAVWLLFNGSQLVPFVPGAPDSRAILPVYRTPEETETGGGGQGQEPWTLPSWGYYEHLLLQDAGTRLGVDVGKRQQIGSNMRILLSKIPLLPHHFDMIPEPTMLSVPMRLPSPHSPGGVVVVKKWVWTLRVWVRSGLGSSFAPSLMPSSDELEEEVGSGWEGEWVLEGDGTKEGREMLLSCLKRDHKRKDLMEWQLVRDRCSRGSIWLR
ncbi:hypothetical protein D9757_001732 [Collybiopsis confluens]|uniref:F-box domain-containing protein n=1 Tax=Collybiopsis confluens TaxID=2823264 RepID=A0A8H5MER1_9AGAR|nr:hypothetical protein D9757_001732 [Collybiopsis confluens]